MNAGRLQRASLFAGLALSLSACAYFGPEGTQRVAIGGGVTVVLPHSPDTGTPMSAAQIIAFQYGGHSLPLTTRFRGDENEFFLVAMDMLGRRALSVSWRVDSLDIQRADWLPAGVPVENIVADLFLVFWPEEAVKNAIWAATSRIDMNDRHRVISVDGEDVIRIEYISDQPASLPAKIRFQNFARGYSIDITSTGVMK